MNIPVKTSEDTYLPYETWIGKDLYTGRMTVSILFAPPDDIDEDTVDWTDYRG